METMDDLFIAALIGLTACVLVLVFLWSGLHEWKWLILGVTVILAGVSAKLAFAAQAAPNARSTTGGLTLSTKWMDKGKENVYPAAAEEAEKAKPRKRSRPTEGVLTYQMYRKK